MYVYSSQLLLLIDFQNYLYEKFFASACYICLTNFEMKDYVSSEVSAQQQCICKMKHWAAFLNTKI